MFLTMSTAQFTDRYLTCVYLFYVWWFTHVWTMYCIVFAILKQCTVCANIGLFVRGNFWVQELSVESCAQELCERFLWGETFSPTWCKIEQLIWNLSTAVPSRCWPEPDFVNVYGAQELIPPAYVAFWRAGTSNRVVVPARVAVNLFLFP